MKDIELEIAAVAARYHYPKPPDFLIRLQEWIQIALRWLSDLFSSFRIILPGLTDTSSVSNVMQILLFLSGVLCAAAIIYFCWTAMTQLSVQRTLARKEQQTALRLLDAAGWRQEAEALAAGRKWKEACRALYLSSLRVFHERKILEFMPTRTNYEYWYALGHHQLLAQEFRHLADRVELVWFGNRLADSSDYDRCRELLDEISVQAAASQGEGAEAIKAVEG